MLTVRMAPLGCGHKQQLRAWKSGLLAIEADWSLVGEGLQ